MSMNEEHLAMRSSACATWPRPVTTTVSTLWKRTAAVYVLAMASLVILCTPVRVNAVEHVFYMSQDGHVRELYYYNGAWQVTTSLLTPKLLARTLTVTLGLR